MLQNLNVLERQNMQNQTIAQLYVDDKKTKYSNKNAKNFYENLYIGGNISRVAIDELLHKIPISKKISNEHFTTFVKQKFPRTKSPRQ